MEMLEEHDETSTLREQLGPFFKHNPYSEIEKKGESYYIVKPWKDESISFVLEPESRSDLITALNNLVLPPRFTGIYHLNSNTMEYIYTLLDKDDVYASREFEFILEGQSYNCKFAETSTRLLLLSKFFRPTGVEPVTEYRNLVLFNLYSNPALVERFRFAPEFLRDRKPVSFFMSGFQEFDEDKIIELSKHLNFLMRYYDRQTPVILIHSPRIEEEEPVKQLQFVKTTFPEKISSRRRDPFLLDLALAAMEVESRLKFIYYYQVLEYAAFYYVDDSIRRDLLKIVCTPDILSYPEKYISSILDAVSESREDEEAKIEKIVNYSCTHDLIWSELQQNIDYFTTRQEFAGGFVLEPFVSEDMTLETFATMWHPKTAVTLRHIRNALVHGRERRGGPIIAPTRENERKIKPWLPIIRRVAEQVIIYGRAT